MYYQVRYKHENGVYKGRKEATQHVIADSPEEALKKCEFLNLHFEVICAEETPEDELKEHLANPYFLSDFCIK